MKTTSEAKPTRVTLRLSPQAHGDLIGQLRGMRRDARSSALIGWFLRGLDREDALVTCSIRESQECLVVLSDADLVIEVALDFARYPPKFWDYYKGGPHNGRFRRFRAAVLVGYEMSIAYSARPQSREPTSQGAPPTLSRELAPVARREPVHYPNIPSELPNAIVPQPMARRRNGGGTDEETHPAKEGLRSPHSDIARILQRNILKD